MHAPNWVVCSPRLARPAVSGPVSVCLCPLCVYVCMYTQRGEAGDDDDGDNPASSGGGDGGGDGESLFSLSEMAVLGSLLVLLGVVMAERRERRREQQQ